MNLQDDHDLTCPWCGETLTVLVDASVPRQTYVEDCHVCCRPIELTVRVAGGEIAELQVRRENE
jgi:transcription elongation factor Elf1